MSAVQTGMGATRNFDREYLAERAVLPASAYTDESYLRRERKTVFQRSWLFAGFLRELFEPGTVVPVEVAGEPVIVLRDNAGELRAFHNVCSHRGSKLICERMEGRKSIVCPYHAWVYDLRGTLFRSPHFAGTDRSELPDLPREELGLKPLRIASWLDFVFVNFDVSAEPFDQYLQPLTARWAGYDLSNLRHGASMRYDFRANWKLVVENFLESYHVPFIHRTLNTYSPFTERYQIRITDHLMGIGSGRYSPAEHDGERLPSWSTSSAEDNVKAEYFSVFPTFLIGVMPDHLFAWSLDPLSADETTEHLHFYFAGDDALSPRYEPQRQTTLESWKQVNDEDWSIIERMHAGSRSSGFSRALLSRRMEKNINGFQALVVDHAGLPDHQ